MLKEFIDEHYLKQKTIEKVKKEFKENKPFSHAVLNDFFKEKKILEVKEELRKEVFESQDSDLFRFNQTKDLSLSKNRVLKEFYKFLNSKEFKNYLKNLTGITTNKDTDASGFIYSDTDYLLPHDDHLEKRKIAYIINLSKGFVKEDGGSLDLFKEDKVAKSIIPKLNSFILFPVITNKTYHQVSEVLTNKERLTIAGWFND